MCEASVRSAYTAGADGAFVVTNGVDVAVREELSQRLSDLPNVRFIHLPQNYGSAGGFYALLASVKESGFDGALVVLDDDNVISKGSLAALLEAKGRFDTTHQTDVSCCAYRPSESLQRRGLQSGVRVFPGPGSFLSFDAIHFLDRFTRHSAGRRRTEPLLMPYAPYGGLLLSGSALRGSTMPDPDFILYEDDTDFTERLTSSGNHILLVPEAEVTDLDGKWSQQPTGPVNFFGARDSTRLFYAVRNRVYFDRRRCTSPLLISRFYANAFLFVLATGVVAMKQGRFRTTRRFFEAVFAGLRGELGIRVFPQEVDSLRLARLDT